MSAINNPTNTFNIQKSKEEIFNAVKKIAEVEKYKYTVENEDDLLNRIRLREKAVIGNNGYNIEFSLTKINDTEFSVKIETSRERGGLDTKVEVDNANYILKDVTDKFSSYLSNKVNEKGEAVIPNKGTGCMMFLSLTLLLIISFASFSQQAKYTILERGWEKTPVFTDTITKEFTKYGGFPVYTKDLDSLLVYVGTFKNINKHSLKRTYFNSDDFKTDHLFFSILNVTHAYGDLYDIDITSVVPNGTYKIKLCSEKGDTRTNKSYINSFYKYIKEAIKLRDEKQ